MTEFSRRGESVTAFERELVERTPTIRPERDADLWICIAKRIGIENLVIVMDELGGEKVHVPTRENFFAALYRPVRNRQIADMQQSTGASLRDLGRAFNLSPTAVQRALVADDA